MTLLKHYGIVALKLILFWVLVFDFQRILFSIHHWSEFESVSWGDWLLTFVHSFRLDITTAAYLSIVPLLFLTLYTIRPSKWMYRCFIGVLFIEILIAAFIHAGEINAYSEWKHKLTARVFVHLSNPDEVFRTADWLMVVWFTIYSVLEIVFGWKIMRWLFKNNVSQSPRELWKRIAFTTGGFVVSLFGLFILARGGFQQIPINTDSAYFSNNYTVNDLSVNSVYFFGNSYVVYKSGEIDDMLPDISDTRAEQIVQEMLDYPKEHDIRILENERPNIVMVILESWAAEALGALSDAKGISPNFDAMASEGVLFTNFYAAGGTSEIGNTSIFSGNPPLPELSVSTQPEKHRKLPSLNQDLKKWGYSSHYIFSGDLKYGNLEGYILDHGFEDVKDESDFPAGLKKGKLNYYDKDLYDLFLKRINATSGKFLHCAFTGSTHFPFDHPKHPNQDQIGKEAAYMNAVIYADECLGEFIANCQKEDWFENTLFVFIADHSRHTASPYGLFDNAFYRIPLLLWGEPIKEEYRGHRVDKVGSQPDFAATLLGQMGGTTDHYPWSKDLLNPKAPGFAMHTVYQGVGWITKDGGFTYQMKEKKYRTNTFAPSIAPVEEERCNAYVKSLYNAYKRL